MASPIERNKAVNERFKEYAPHPKYGNIYHPHHIEDQGGLRYKVVDQHDTPVTESVCWVVATSIAQRLNNSQNK